MSRFWKELSCEPADIVDADLCLMDAQADVRVFGFMKLSSVSSVLCTVSQGIWGVSRWRSS